MNDFVIETNNLHFQYSKKRPAVTNLSLRVPKGSIYGFLGPNGAGKSTTMRLLTAILPDDAGSVSLFGESLNSQLPSVFSKIGALVESPALYLHLTGYDNLQYIATLRNSNAGKIDEVLHTVDLFEAKDRKVKGYSLGMKQRLAIAMALLAEPELLLLDEPVNGLDPTGIVEMRNLLVKLNKEHGVSIFVSSHLLSEIEKMCTHVGIISNGVLRFQGTMSELSQKFGSCSVSLQIKDARVWLEKLSITHTNVKAEGDDRLLLTLPDKDSIPAFVKSLLEQGALLYEFKIQDGLEEWFMSVTKEL
jgi:ABC-2 type transport system ATP-binding protein